MRSTYLAAGIVGLIGIFAACGNKSDHGGVADEGGPSPGGKSGTAGKTGKSGNSGKDDGGEGGEDSGGFTPITGGSGGGSTTGGNGGTGGVVPSKNAPIIKITSPTASSDPEKDAIVAQTVKVLCSVTKSDEPGADDVDTASVEIILVDKTGKADKKPGSTTKNANEYSAEFILTSAPSGKVSFQCVASDRSKAKGLDQIDTYVDQGPVITPEAPLPMAAVPVKGGLPIKFKVAKTPLDDDDAGSDIAEVTFTIDNKKIDVKETSPGTWEGAAAIDDTDVFPIPPTGAIAITAKNKRTPTAAVSTLPFNITVDSEGPVITFISPAEKAVVGGKVKVVFDVIDVGSHTAPDSVYLTRFEKDTPQRYKSTDAAWSRVGDRYTYVFDSKVLEIGDTAQVTVDIYASDQAGNSSATANGRVLHLDNFPPVVDLDPLNVRARVGGNCSGSFDPVGNGAMNDLDGSFGSARSVARIATFRAFVVEQTNGQAGQLFYYYSGTDQTTVRLYARPADDTTKLLVGKNPSVDNTCDDLGGIDGAIDPPRLIGLTGLAKSGTLSSKDSGPAVQDPGGYCASSTGSETPERLCPSKLSDMWYVPSRAEGVAEPYVYALSPTPSDDSCTGIQWSFVDSGQPEGWICLAARAVDNIGNVGISRPIRICVDDPTNAVHPACATMSTEPPSCTDGCTPPARVGPYILQQP